MKTLLRSLFLLSLLILIPFISLGQSAYVTNLRLLHDQYVDGVQGMSVVCDANVKGMNGKTCHARMFVEHPKGKPWYDINGQYRSLIGMVSAGFDFVPNYDDCYYNNGFHIWIPVSELHLTPEQRQYFIKVAIYSGSFENQLNLL